MIKLKTQIELKAAIRLNDCHMKHINIGDKNISTCSMLDVAFFCFRTTSKKVLYGLKKN